MIVERKTSQRKCGPGGRRLTKIQEATSLENLWPEVWSKMGEAAQKKEKQKDGETRSQNSTLLGV